MNLDKLYIFVKRLKNINIDIELSSNFPWIYLDSVNGNTVKENFYSEFKYTIGFSPLRADEKFEFLNINNLFIIIRKYRQSE